jgi:5,5'-dehydrodivanillate O-demethylase
MNSFAGQFMYRVPVDDSHTLHVTYSVYPQPDGETVQQDVVPYYMIPDSVDANGDPIWPELDNNGGQDTMAWVAQGGVVDRTRERLAESDRGVIMWRELLQRQLDIVDDGGEPMNVFRDPKDNVCIVVPPRDGSPLRWAGPNAGFMRRLNSSWKHSPVVTELVERFHGKDALTPPVH